MREVGILFFIHTFSCFFSTNIDSTLLRRWAVRQSANVCISYWFGLPCISLLCLSVPFLIIKRALTITGTVVVLRYLIFKFVFLDLCIYLFYYILWLINYFLALTYQLEGNGLLLQSLTSISGLLLSIFLSVWIAKSQRIGVTLAFIIGSGYCSYHFSELHIFQWI